MTRQNRSRSQATRRADKGRLERVELLGAECCVEAAPYNWASKILKDLIASGTEIDADAVISALQDRGWYCAPDDTDDTDERVVGGPGLLL